MIGARVFLPSSRLGMIIDHTPDTLPARIKNDLDHLAPEAFIYRVRTDGQPTLRAVNRYKGQLRMCVCAICRLLDALFGRCGDYA